MHRNEATGTAPAQHQGRQLFHATPRIQVLPRLALAVAAFYAWFKLMEWFHLAGGIFGIILILPVITAVGLLFMLVQARRTVVVDDTGFLFYRGSRETRFPWYALSEPGAVKEELVVGWHQLNLRATVDGRIIKANVHNVFGVGLPVASIVQAMKPWLERTRRGGNLPIAQ